MPSGALAALLCAAAAIAPTGGQVIIPESGIEKPGDIGQRAHTNTEIFVPNGSAGRLHPPGRAATGGGSSVPAAPQTTPNSQR